MSYPILSIRSLSKSFGTAPALSSIDLDVYAGEVLGVVGPHGAGKSTLLLCAAGILKPSLGSVVVLGRRVTSAQDSFDVAYVPPHPVYYPFLSVRDALSSYSAKLTRETRTLSRAIDSSIDRMLLTETAQQRVGSLDSGQVLCVALAQAIVARPRVLLLDASLDQMDRPNARIARAAIARAAEAVAGVIITSRDATGVMGVSTRNVFLNEGRLSQPHVDADSLPLERIASRVAERHH
ncbi:MAG: ATP-binding cassette domain-containing protein [Gemmatimonadaceae bacterium]